MKRKTLLILTLALSAALLLSACAKPVEPTTPDEPAPVEPSTPAPVEPTTPTEPETPAAPAVVLYPLFVKADETVTADLDGDGADEEIVYTVKDGAAVLTVNGAEFGADLEAAGFYCDAPETAYFALVNIDRTDSLLEIAVMDAGPSDDARTSFFRYGDGALRYLGNAQGYVFNEDGTVADMSFRGFGSVNSYVRLSVLQTWFAKADWRVGEDGVTLAAQSVFEPINSVTEVTVLADLAAYEDADAASERATLAAGTALTLVATDNVQWVQVEDADENSYWLQLNVEAPFNVELADGSFAASTEALEGLSMAD